MSDLFTKPGEEKDEGVKDDPTPVQESEGIFTVPEVIEEGPGMDKLKKYGKIALGVGAAAAGGALAYNKSPGFKSAVDSGVSAVGNKVDTVQNYIKDKMSVAPTEAGHGSVKASDQAATFNTPGQALAARNEPLPGQVPPVGQTLTPQQQMVNKAKVQVAQAPTKEQVLKKTFTNYNPKVNQ